MWIGETFSAIVMKAEEIEAINVDNNDKSECETNVSDMSKIVVEKHIHAEIMAEQKHNHAEFVVEEIHSHCEFMTMFCFL